MNSGAIRAGEAYVELSLKDMTAPAVKSFESNMGRIQNAASEAANGSRMIRSPGGGWMLGPAGTNTATAATMPTSTRKVYDAEEGFTTPVTDAERARGRAVTAKTGGDEAKGFWAGQQRMVEKWSGRLMTQVAGVSAGLATLNIASSSVADTLKKKMLDPGIDAFQEFADSFSKGIEGLPVIGDLVALINVWIMDLTGALEEQREAERRKKQVEDQIRQQDIRRRFREGNEGVAKQLDRMGDSDVLANATRVTGSIFGESQGRAAISSLQRGREEALALIAKRMAEDIRAAGEAIGREANESGLLVIGDAADSDAILDAVRGNELTMQRFRDMTAMIREEATRQAAAIARESEAAQSDVMNTILALQQEEADRLEERLAKEREVSQFMEGQELDLSDRRRMLELDREAGGLDLETVEGRTRKAEIEAERELLRIQQRLDMTELDIIAKESLTLEQRERLLAGERELAGLEADLVREQLDRAIAEAAKVVKDIAPAPGAGGGTFSAAVASRSQFSRTAEEQLTVIKRIEANTRNSRTF